MKKDSKLFNRSLALAMAAAMTVTSVPSSVLAADLFGDGAADTAPVVVEEMAETDLFDSGAAEVAEEPAEVFTAPAETEEVTVDTFETPAQDPGKVTGLYVDAEEKCLKWDAVTAADYYRVYVTDGTYYYAVYDGYWYSSASYDENKIPYTRMSSNSLSLSKRLYKYTKNGDGGWTNTGIVDWAAGVPYTITVQAVNTSTKLDAEENQLEPAYGTVSDAFIYTPAAALAPDKVMNVEVKDGALSFDYTKTGHKFQMKITDGVREYYGSYPSVKDGVDQFDDAYAAAGRYDVRYVSAYAYEKGTYGWQRSVGADGKAIPAFQAGGAYTIQVRAYAEENGKKTPGEWSDPYTFTAAAKAKPSTPNIQAVGSGQAWTLKWTEADDAERYEILVKDASGNEYKDGEEYYCPYYDYYEYNGNWYSLGISYLKSLTFVASEGAVPVQPFQMGQPYTIQVRGYNSTWNYSEGKYDYQYGDWSKPVTVTYSAAAAAKPDKPVITDKNVLSWNPVTDAESYQVQVVDNLGREYFSSGSVGADGKLDSYRRVSGTSVTLQPYGEYYDEEDDCWYSEGLSLFTYQSVDGDYVAVKNPNNGAPIKAFENYPSEDYARTDLLPISYTLKVRSVKDGLYSEWSESVTYSVTDGLLVGIKQTPAKPTGVRVKTEGDEASDNLTNGAELVWNYLENVGGYEILVKDAAGNEYSRYDAEKAGKGELERLYYSVGAGLAPSVPLNDMAHLKAYVLNTGAPIVAVKGADGKDLTAFAAGQTYTIQVRGVNTYQEYDGEKKQYGEEQKLYGEWSDPVSYTVPAKEAITDLSFVKEEKGSYYFTYSAKVSGAEVYYQVAEDATFATSSLIRDWRRDYSSEDKLVVYSDGLMPGKTYYVRAVYSADGKPTKEEVAAMVIPVASFTAAAKAPKDITGLEYYETDSDEYAWFQFDAVLESGVDYYEVQCSTDGVNWNVVSVRESGDRFSVNLKNFSEGTLQVRAAAYVYQYNEATGKEDKIYGKESNPVSVAVTKATTAIDGLKLAEKTPEGYVFTFTGAPRNSESVELWYSTDPAFVNNKKLTTVVSDAEGRETQLSPVSYTDLEPGKTYYVRARVYNPYSKTEAEKYSAFTNTAKVTAEIPRISVSGSTTDTTVTLTMGAASTDYYLTGFEIQKKDGKSFVALEKTTDNTFKDTKLQKDTTYQYRVRPYYYNSETKKTKNGTWVYYQTMTWGGSLKATARAASKNSIKLSWKKISGAQGYEVYRMAADSAATEKADGLYNGFSKYELIKTIKKASTVKYTDKKLDKNLAYRYKVVAYKTVKGKKYTIAGYTDRVNLAFSSAFTAKRIDLANGKVKLTWNPVYAASGYLVEVQDKVTDKWTTYKKLKAKATSITLPKNSEKKAVSYRVRAYKGTEYTNAYEVWVAPYLAPVSGVKAKASAANGSITVSWKPVAGADYYKVYRTTSSDVLYDKSAKAYMYNYDNSVLVGKYVEDASKVTGYRLAKASERNVTSIVDKPLTYTVEGVKSTLYAGPTPGVKYYYYVVACKYAQEYGYKSEDNYEYAGGYEGAKGKAASATVTSITKVSKPAIKKVTAGKKSATIQWKKVSKADGYVIYRSTNKKKGFVQVGTVSKGSTVKYTNKKLTSRKTYYYKVKAYRLNEAGVKVLSGFSGVKSVKAK
ncbi:MAG: hypothetical protein Q4D55_05530 [Eubacteriales bacterium]|nr:hypothetical protein [Eubacteriales bacterium]